MSKIRTLSDLQDALDKSLAWRLKEIAYVKSNAMSASSYAQAALLRAGVPLIYAHWEGFVKGASEVYLEYVANQHLRYEELASCFVVFAAKKHLTSLVQSKRAAINIEAVDFFRNNSGKAANISLSNAVDTESNLSSVVFQNIAISLGIQTERYAVYSNFLDKSLLERRNKIAHGEYLDIDAEAFGKLADEVLNLLRMYKTDIENLASTTAYRIRVEA
ncbi:hypothetical protein FYM52_00385 [Comamonas sp. CAH-2]|uniref:MAE_28990/MAE_18760 family HEPN-like nuclease n=1 Tax=Comamonas sp. CAH-2 TaxID=2605745 RepID=UPI00139686FA|nr:hypothetical protein [Comamonas sp. CAH-2]